jgi:outer membrane protein, multidrug efflux system
MRSKSPRPGARAPGRRPAWILVTACAGCAAPPAPPPPAPSLAPAAPAAQAVALADAAIRPMYREIVAVDLPSVVRLALAQNLDLQRARANVEAASGRYEGSVEAIFPVFAPTVAWQHVSGANQNANGTLVHANFSNLLPALTLQWIVNPGRVVYDIVASKRRMEASQDQERAARLETLRRAVDEYYDLLLEQAEVASAQQAVAEAEESARLTSARARAGTALAADETRAQAFLAGRRQDLLLAVARFDRASLALAATLDLDPVVTLSPAPREVLQVTLVRDDVVIDELLQLAVRHRPDLESARALLAAAKADDSAVLWNSFGPQLFAAYSYGSITTRGADGTSGPHQRSVAAAGATVAANPAVFGQDHVADADVRAAALEVEARLLRVRGEVVAAQQASLTNAALLPIATDQVRAAEESLRLAQVGLKAGTTLLLDTLQAEQELDAARVSLAAAAVHYDQAQVDLLAALGLLEESSFPQAPPVAEQ